MHDPQSASHMWHAFGGPEKDRFVVVVGAIPVGLGLLLRLLGQEYGLDVGQHATLSDGDAGQELV